jgi:hypothetical protein
MTKPTLMKAKQEFSEEELTTLRHHVGAIYSKLKSTMETHFKEEPVNNFIFSNIMMNVLTALMAKLIVSMTKNENLQKEAISLSLQALKHEVQSLNTFLNKQTKH